jgi:hypothetical protein
MYTSESILALPDLKKELVSVPEWGMDVWVQEINALERDRLRMEMFPEGEFDPVNNTGKILVRCIVDEQGNRIFSDAQAADLGKKSLAALNRLLTVAKRLNLLEAQDGDNLEKN